MEVVILNSNRIHSHLYPRYLDLWIHWLWKKQYRILDADLDINSLLNNMEVAPFITPIDPLAKFLFPVPTTLSSNLQVWVFKWRNASPGDTVRTLHEDRERGNTSTAQRMPNTAANYRSWRKPGGGSPCMFQRVQPEDTLILGLLASRAVINRFWG